MSNIEVLNMCRCVSTKSPNLRASRSSMACKPASCLNSGILSPVLKRIVVCMMYVWMFDVCMYGWMNLVLQWKRFSKQRLARTPLYPEDYSRLQTLKFRYLNYTCIYTIDKCMYVCMYVFMYYVRT